MNREQDCCDKCWRPTLDDGVSYRVGGCKNAACECHQTPTKLHDHKDGECLTGECHSKQEGGEKKPLDARACAERIVYLHGTLHMNDILPDLRELVEATEERVRGEVIREAVEKLKACADNCEGEAEYFYLRSLEVVSRLQGDGTKH